MHRKSSNRLRGLINWSARGLLPRLALLFARADMTFGLARTVGYLSRIFHLHPAEIRFGPVRVWADFKEPSERHVFLGFAERDVVALYQRLLVKGDVVMDIGTNVGFHLALATSLVGKEGRTIGFEPNPLLHSRLNKFAEANPFGNAQIVHAAASDFIGTATLYGGEQHGVSSLEPWWQHVHSTEVRVPTITLDHFLETHPELNAVKLIKIDVEGHQARVVSGCRKALAEAKIGALIVELSPPGGADSQEDNLTVMNAFWSTGYQIFGISGQGLWLITKPSEELCYLAPGFNILALRKDLIERLVPITTVPPLTTRE